MIRVSKMKQRPRTQLHKHLLQNFITILQYRSPCDPELIYFTYSTETNVVFQDKKCIQFLTVPH